jgi:hypothetical protein
MKKKCAEGRDWSFMAKSCDNRNNKKFRLSMCVYCGDEIMCILRSMEICPECYNKKKAAERKGMVLPKLFKPILTSSS